MSIAFIIYLIFTAVPAIKFLTGIGFVIWLAGVPLGLLIGASCRDINDDKTLWNFTLNDWIKKKWKVAILLLVISKLIPTQEVTAYMLAGYGVQKLAENQVVQSLSSDGVDILKGMLSKAKAELEEKSAK